MRSGLWVGGPSYYLRVRMCSVSWNPNYHVKSFFFFFLAFAQGKLLSFSHGPSPSFPSINGTKWGGWLRAGLHCSFRESPGTTGGWVLQKAFYRQRDQNSDLGHSLCGPSDCHPEAKPHILTLTGLGARNPFPHLKWG